MKKNCLVKENKKFLFWKWTDEYYSHRWAYKGEFPKLRRQCVRCGRRQILVAGRNTGNYETDYEDWRLEL